MSKPHQTTINLELDDYAADHDETSALVPVTIKTDVTGVTLTTEDGQSVWIEQQSGRLVVHVYALQIDEPVNVRVGTTAMVVTSDISNDPERWYSAA